MMLDTTERLINLIIILIPVVLIIFGIGFIRKGINGSVGLSLIIAAVLLYLSLIDIRSWLFFGLYKFAIAGVFFFIGKKVFDCQTRELILPVIILVVVIFFSPLYTLAFVR